MNADGVLSISEVNAVPDGEFAWLFGNVIEYCPEAARHVATRRPFARVEDLKIVFAEYLDSLEETEKVEILAKHPDLGRKLSDEDNLTSESENEQRSAGIHDMTKEERQAFNNLNYLYKSKFRFPFVICARENRVQSILAGIEERVQNSMEAEIATGIDEVKKICWMRINDLVWSDS